MTLFLNVETMEGFQLEYNIVSALKCHFNLKCQNNFIPAWKQFCFNNEAMSFQPQNNVVSRMESWSCFTFQKNLILTLFQGWNPDVVSTLIQFHFAGWDTHMPAHVYTHLHSQLWSVLVQACTTQTSGHTRPESIPRWPLDGFSLLQVQAFTDHRICPIHHLKDLHWLHNTTNLHACV